MTSNQLGRKRLSRELRAVLTIFNVDEELKRKALLYVDIERETVDWDGILNNDYGGGHSTAIKRSQAI